MLFMLDFILNRAIFTEDCLHEFMSRLSEIAYSFIGSPSVKVPVAYGCLVWGSHCCIDVHSFGVMWVTPAHRGLLVDTAAFFRWFIDTDLGPSSP